MRFSFVKTVSFFAIVLAQSVIAKTYTIGPCEVKGGDARLSDVLCDLAQDAVLSLGHQVSPPNKKTDDGNIRIKALRLDSAYSLTANLVIGDQVVSSAKLKATSPDEFDSLVPRLVRTALSGGDVKEDAKVGEVSKDESQFRKVNLHSKHSFDLGFGGAGVGNVSATSPYYNFNIGGSVDWTSFRLQFLWDLFWHAGERDGTFSTLGFNGNFFLTDEQSGPYIGPKIAYGWVSQAHDSDSVLDFRLQGAFVLGIVAGWEFFRNYEASLSLEAVLETALVDVGEGSYPTLFGLRGIIHF